ncbi:hypothetical protein LXA43DRAFT_974073 [Ganoderma leucocontextum]|nr:hypothetical protein LXA43DRAFT_974073 [Ganoderma leucocontextum]
MAEWKAPFKQGISSFRAGKHEAAIASFSEASRLGGDPATIFDARAAVYQKLGKLKEALRDAKAVIDSQPGRWQGYARSARLFHQIRKFDAASRMVDLALERIPSEQASRRDEMLALRREVESSHEQAVKEAARLASLRAYHFGKLPIEIANTMFSLLLAEDHAYVVVLTQVCKNWRSAVLDMPAFWSSLVVKDKHPARKIKVWKERSRNRIRDLALTDDFSRTPSVLEELGKLSLKSLVTLRLDNFPIRQLRAHLPSIGDQCLQTLRGWHDGSAASLIGELRWDDKTPYFSPRTLDITSSVGLRIDWAQLSDNLTDLQSCYFTGTLGQHDWHHVLWLLHKNSSLADLEISHWLPSHTDPPPDRELPPTIIMPKLSTFKIMASIPERLLSVLSFPSLKSLDISSCRGTLNNTLQHLVDGKAATLTSLAIRSSTFDPHLLVRTLATTSSLEFLQLSVIGGDAVKVVLEALARVQPSLPNGDASSHRTSPCVYCPALHTLDCSQNQTVRGGELVRLVKLRITEAEKSAAGDEEEPAQAGATCVKPLQTLIVDGCPMLDSEVLPWLREKVPSVSCVYLTKKAARWKR